MAWVATKLNVKEMHDWYNVTNQVLPFHFLVLILKDLAQLHGRTLLYRYSSLYQLLSTVFPDYNWEPWKFNKIPRNILDDINTQRKFLEWAGKQLNVKEMSDWYKVTYKVYKNQCFSFIFKKDVFNLGGSRVLTRNSDSLYKTLQNVFPEYEWCFWKFDHCPRHYWHTLENQRKFMEWAGKELKIKDINDWYNVTNQVYK